VLCIIFCSRCPNFFNEAIGNQLKRDSAPFGRNGPVSVPPLATIGQVHHLAFTIMPTTPPLSDEARRNIVSWRLVYGLAVEDIATLVGCSVRTVYSVLACWRDWKEVCNPLACKRGAPRLLDKADLRYIRGAIEARPKIYLDELQEELAYARGVEVSIATLSQTLRRMAYSYKRVSRAALERNEDLRAIWIAEYGDIPREFFVWLDESSIDDSTNHRHNGWALTGLACVSREMFLRGHRYSILPALTVDGIVALDIVEGSINKDLFITFLKEQIVSVLVIQVHVHWQILTYSIQVPILQPYPGERSVVVLDNCAIHHNEEIRALIVDDCGKLILSLLTYVIHNSYQQEHA
jgi:transposase